MKKKLNLKWVTDTIGEDYKKWRMGDVVLLQSQTGTGKTHFIKKVLIDHMKEYESMLLVSNRTNLKRQLKKDLLSKYGMNIPDSLEELDAITKINNNITITSYHAIQDSSLDEEYNLGNCNIGYDYIVLDECHYIFADGSFNNKTRIAYQELVYKYHFGAIKIFISATMDEIRQPIHNCLEKGFGEKPTVHSYTTGIDYSYVIPKYFKKIKDIATTIRNDKSDDKWLIFVSNLNDAILIKNDVGDEQSSIIKSGTQSEELTSIINNSRFERFP